jgi:hypothetical protein
MCTHASHLTHQVCTHQALAHSVVRGGIKPLWHKAYWVVLGCIMRACTKRLLGAYLCTYYARSYGCMCGAYTHCCTSMRGAPSGACKATPPPLTGSVGRGRPDDFLRHAYGGYVVPYLGGWLGAYEACVVPWGTAPIYRVQRSIKCCLELLGSGYGGTGASGRPLVCALVQRLESRETPRRRLYVPSQSGHRRSGTPKRARNGPGRLSTPPIPLPPRLFPPQRYTEPHRGL